MMGGLEQVQKFGATVNSLKDDPVVKFMIDCGVNVDFNMDQCEIVCEGKSMLVCFSNIFEMRSFVKKNEDIIRDIESSDNKSGLFFFLDKGLAESSGNDLSIAGFRFEAVEAAGLKAIDAVKPGDVDFLLFGLDKEDVEGLIPWIKEDVLSKITQEDFDDLSSEGADYILGIFESWQT